MKCPACKKCGAVLLGLWVARGHVLTRLSDLLWGGGAAICLSSSFLFQTEDPRVDCILVTMLAFFVVPVMLMILAFDRPVRGGGVWGPGTANWSETN